MCDLSLEMVISRVLSHQIIFFTRSVTLLVTLLVSVDCYLVSITTCATAEFNPGIVVVGTVCNICRSRFIVTLQTVVGVRKTSKHSVRWGYLFYTVQ